MRAPSHGTPSRRDAIRTYGGYGQVYEEQQGREGLKQAKPGPATDMRGVPLVYRRYAGNDLTWRRCGLWPRT